MVWDVNGYYRQLGVSSYATREELRKAYRRKKGWRSPRLTYILKQLLDLDIRAAYDSTPLGDVFWDRYVEDDVRRQAHKEASRLRREGRIRESEILGKYDSPYSEGDFEFDFDAALSEELGGRRRDRYIEPPWPWSYYRWQTTCADTARLERWQAALVEALGGRPHEIAVGYVGGIDLSCTVQRVGFRVVAFLGDWAQPSKDRAEQAARQIEELDRGAMDNG